MARSDNPPEIANPARRLPHRFPGPPYPEYDVIAWECQACGLWINDGDRNPPPCPIDWRAKRA